MSGIYVHIPFCKKACHYCNFHFSTSLGLKDTVIDAICKEAILRQDFLKDKHIETVYFGGGTPGMLAASEIGRVLDTLAGIYTWSPDAEITLEANPDDLDLSKLRDFKATGINRLSIGVQSFFDTDLIWMGRVHYAFKSEQCLADAFAAGFENLTIDLIYGCPTTSHSQWEHNILKTMDMGIPHISAYSLTVEDKTALSHFVKTGKVRPPDPGLSSEQFEILMDLTGSRGYEHYEISNFALKGHHAIHNTAYWQGKHYLGLGPSAHSYDGVQRSWNVANNKKYADSILSGQLPMETEILTVADRYNEYLMTGLRTIWGVEKSKITAYSHHMADHFFANITRHIECGHIVNVDQNYVLTKSGKHFADRIAMDLFYTD